MHYAFELSVIFVLLFLNGLLAMAEIAIVSARKAKLHQWAEDGDRGAKLALELAGSPTTFFSTVQIGITMVGICAGALGEASFSEDLKAVLMSVPAISSYAKPVALGLVVTIITFFSLILGELVPKRLALHAPERIASVVAGPMDSLSKLVKPVVSILGNTTNLILQLVGIKEKKEEPLTEAELHVLVEQATEAGVFEEAEQDMVTSVLRLGDQKVASLMTPRPDIVWLDADADEKTILSVVENNTHGRFPVAEVSLDHILGIVEAKSIMMLKMRGEPINLRALLSQPPYVPENMTGLELLDELRDSRQKLAIVLDEYGGLQGMVSREDIFQAIVGELPLVGETPKWEAVEREDGSWLVDALMPVQNFKELFSIEELDGEEEADYQTLAGFILYFLEHIPSTGEHFEWGAWRFEVVDMDRHKIDKVLVSKVQEASPFDPSASEPKES